MRLFRFFTSVKRKMNTQFVWNNFSNELLGFIQSRVNDTHLAQDLLQDIFIKIHLNIDRLQKGDKLNSWIYQITRNTIIDHYRKKKLPLSDTSDMALWLPESVEQTDTRFNSCLTSFIDQLPDQDKEALYQTTFGELSQKEYAASINQRYSTVKSRVQRARVKLKTLFVDCCSIEADRYGNIISSAQKDCNC